MSNFLRTLKPIKMNSQELRQIAKAACFNIMDICPFCNALKRPKPGDRFLIYSESQNKMIKARFEEIDISFEIGISPHIISYKNHINSEFVEVYKFCSICEEEMISFKENLSGIALSASEYNVEIMEINLWKELYQKRAFKGF